MGCKIVHCWIKLVKIIHEFEWRNPNLLSFCRYFLSFSDSKFISIRRLAQKSVEFPAIVFKCAAYSWYIHLCETCPNVLSFQQAQAIENSMLKCVQIVEIPKVEWYVLILPYKKIYLNHSVCLIPISTKNQLTLEIQISRCLHNQSNNVGKKMRH